jgi:hypothetical protein
MAIKIGDKVGMEINKVDERRVNGVYLYTMYPL